LRTDKQIHLQLDPLVEKLTTQHQDVMTRLSALDQWKADLERRYDGVKQFQNHQDQEQKKLADRFDQMASLDRLQDRRRVLATIRAEIQLANETKRVLPVSDIVDYKNALRFLPSSLADYWNTVAAVVNYQSLLNQLSHEAPDPAKVAQDCGFMADSTVIGPRTVVDCVIYLDTNVFIKITFKDSVVHYQGGPVGLGAVVFENCRFILDIPPNTHTPQVNLLNALLQSPDQKRVKVPAG
jgi:hypothetical protein